MHRIFSAVLRIFPVVLRVFSDRFQRVTLLTIVRCISVLTSSDLTLITLVEFGDKAAIEKIRHLVFVGLVSVAISRPQQSNGDQVAFEAMPTASQTNA